jgi:hypothetical protein
MVCAVSVTANSTSVPLRLRLPSCTSPPRRNVRAFGASLAITCEGEKKNTRLLWNALSTRPAANATAPTMPPIRARRL